MKAIDENTIGGRIRKARVSCKLTTRELAEKVGVSQNYLSVVERNDKKQASPALLQKIAEYTGVSLAWLQNGDSIAAEAANFDDIQLLLTLILQQAPSITKDTVATVLAVDSQTVDAILRGEVRYNPLWESGISNLIQRLDIPAVRKKIRGLDALLQKEEEKKSGIELFWGLRSYLSKKFKVPFKFARQPLRIQGELEYTQFELHSEDESQRWVIHYFSSPLEDDDFGDIVYQAIKLSETCCVAVAFSDSDTYRRMHRYCEKKLCEHEAAEEFQGAWDAPDIHLILIDSESPKVKSMEAPFV